MSTIIKTKGKEKTYSCITEEEVFENIRKGLLRFEIHGIAFRMAADYAKRNGQVALKRYCGLVTLKVGKLPGREEVERVMSMVTELPHTLMAWRDRDGRTVYIVCRAAWKEEAQPRVEEEMQTYQRNAYKVLHHMYSTQLMMTIDAVEPLLDEEIPYSYDPQAYLSPEAMPIYTHANEVRPATRELAGPSPTFPCLPGMNEDETRSYIFHSCRTKAAVESRKDSTDEANQDEKMMCLLARYCYESGLGMAYALERALWISGWYGKRLVLEIIFQNAFDKKLSRKIPFGHINGSTLLTLQTEAFLESHYELRKNVLTGIVQYRERDGYNFAFCDLTDEAMNSMTIRALKAGLGSWDKDIRRLINSNDIRRYDPLADYLHHLPRWDGQDRIAPLAARIQTNCLEFPRYLHVWMRSMVAHWLGKDNLHGNAIVPLLIGDQGCGKTTFASILLPNKLRAYYNDKVDFRSEADLMSALSQFALINIDEFDSLKKSQQPTLKYLLSKSEVKVRPIYGKVIEHRRRYASFIATTNLLRPLIDRTGSRRFICVRVTSGTRIDTFTPIEYDQLYAQLMYEIEQGEPYWFDETDTAEIQRQNAPFLKVNDLSEMIDQTFTRGEEGGGEWMTIDEMIKALQRQYPYLLPSTNMHKDVGKLLREKGYETRKTKLCNKYLVALLNP